MALGPLMIDIEGSALTPVDRELIQAPAVGGVILFTRNFENIEQVSELIAEIKSLRSPSVLVAVDQEGGRVQRFRDGFTALPPVGFFGLQYDIDAGAALELVRHTGWLLAAELLAVGADLNFGPVLDVDHGVSEIVGDRALHRDPEVVARLATAMMSGMKAAGMAAVGKHFPGHGAVVADSHHELPADRREYADVTGDLGVFERLVRAGLPGIMTAHVVFPELDPMPASFSRWWIGAELRDRIGFRGAVFSDDLSMLATQGFGSIGERVGLALEAGSDMVLICNDRQRAERAVGLYADFVRPGSMARLARMHGRPQFAAGALRADPRWCAACEALDRALDRPPLELDA